MFKRLREHWKVNNKGLILILCTFAVTGTLTAFLSRQITIWFDIERLSFLWWTLKLIVLLLGYQALILIVGFCFGMFQFFWNYEKKILRRMGIKIKGNVKESNHKKNSEDQLLNKRELSRTQHLAIFASGTGSNTQKIINYYNPPQPSLQIERRIQVALIVCNNPAAGVLQIAANEKIPVLLIEKNRFYKDGYLAELKKYNIDFIVLSGFLWKIPAKIITTYAGKIVNIHPALLPEFGGKGMYGLKVHEAVINAGKKESGITIHYVDELYDHGEIIFQARCTIDKNDNAESLAKKVHALEYDNYAKVIEEMIISQQTAKSFQLLD